MHQASLDPCTNGELPHPVSNLVRKSSMPVLKSRRCKHALTRCPRACKFKLKLCQYRLRTQRTAFEHHLQLAARRYLSEASCPWCKLFPPDFDLKPACRMHFTQRSAFSVDLDFQLSKASDPLQISARVCEGGLAVSWSGFRLG